MKTLRLIFAVAVLTALLAVPAWADDEYCTAQVIGNSGQTVTVLDAYGYPRTFLVSPSTMGYANLRVGNTVYITYVPSTRFVRSAALFDPRFTPGVTQMQPSWWSPRGWDRGGHQHRRNHRHHR